MIDKICNSNTYFKTSCDFLGTDSNLQYLTLGLITSAALIGLYKSYFRSKADWIEKDIQHINENETDYFLLPHPETKENFINKITKVYGIMKLPTIYDLARNSYIEKNPSLREETDISFFLNNREFLNLIQNTSSNYQQKLREELWKKLKPYTFEEIKDAALMPLGFETSTNQNDCLVQQRVPPKFYGHTADPKNEEKAAEILRVCDTVYKSLQFHSRT